MCASAVVRTLGVLASAVTVHAGAQPATRQPVRTPVRDTTIVAAPGAQYRAGRLHRVLMGTNYRELWTTPIPIDVVPLRVYGGGLRPLERGGGLQTRSLRFAGADGREYVFRSLDKEQARSLPPELRETLVDRVLQDLVSAYHPAGPLVVSRLLDATGIRHARPRLVILPDDTLLGAFQHDFANQVGMIEERPGRGFDETETQEGAGRVIGTEELLTRMRKDPGTRVATRAYLAARLFDVFVNDRDRHRDQWRWARFGNGDAAVWEPVPRDRDMAFAKYEGLLPALARQGFPQMVTFTRTYPNMEGLNWGAREIDRRLLAGLDSAVWDSVGHALQQRLTDTVLDDAVAAMPAAFIAVNGRELRDALRARRDQLPQATAAFYALLASEVDVDGTDQRDLAEVTRLADGAVDVVLAPLVDGGDKSEPYLHRRFQPRETREVRIYLRGGHDRAVVRGPATRGVTVRIVGGKGDDILVDSATAGPEATRFYDAEGANRVQRGPRTAVDRRVYVPPPVQRAQDPIRDWGHEWRASPWFSYATDIGLFIGAGRTRYDYGFRADPYRSRMTVQAGYAIGANRPRVQFAGDFQRSNSRHHTTLVMRASGIEVVRFHGIGNETPADQPRSFYRVFQNQYLIEPAYVMPLPRHISASLGVVGQYTTSRPSTTTFVGATHPYGSGDFGQVGARFGLSMDTRDRPVAATRGVYLTSSGTLFPPVADVARTFGEVHGAASTYLRLARPLDPTLALRVGGKRVWGTFPFYEAAFVGGSNTLRGWSEQRFAGDAAVYGNAELRLRLTRFFLFIPGELGVFGLADAGRVYASGERSDAWHTGLGGGLWLAPLRRTNTVSLAIARGRERTGVYLASGFSF